MEFKLFRFLIPSLSIYDQPGQIWIFFYLLEIENRKASEWGAMNQYWMIQKSILFMIFMSTVYAQKTFVRIEIVFSKPA